MKKILALALALVLVLALAACGGSKTEAPAAEEAAPAVEEAAPAAEAPAAAPAAPEAPAEAPAAPEGDASGEMGEPTGEPLPANGEIEITVDGVTGVAAFEESDNGDQATKGLIVTFNGETYTGSIDKGVYTADDAAAQPIFTAIQEARGAMGIGQPSGEPTGEPAA